MSSPCKWLIDTYCFDRATEALRVMLTPGNQTSTLNRLGRFQGRNVALDQVLTNGEVKALSAQVTTLVSGGFDTSAFMSESELDLRRGPDTGPIRIKGVDAVYPELARARHISGTVHMVATVGVDGHVTSVAVTDSPDPSLSDSAMKAVRQSTYKPAILNGPPTEADLTISISYNTGAY